MSRLLVSVLALSLLVGCATTGAPRELVDREDSYFLLVPTEGYPLAVDAASRKRLEEAYSDLIEKGDPKTATEVSNELLGRDPGLDPARVLKAELFFVDGRFDQILTELLPIVDSSPTYTAAQLLYGRASEKVGNLVEALEAYRSISVISSLARSRALDLEPRAIEILAHRIEDALARGRIVEASDQLQQLQQWAPEADRTLELAADVAEALDDPDTELQVLRRMSDRQPEDLDLLARRVELELAVGDPAVGMRLLEDAATQNPDNPDLAATLVQARFDWRLQLLPPEVRELGQAAELTRGDFAALLYWLFPEIRYGRGGAKIANDVLEHPYREQIVKVANSGVMDIDPSLHRFEPYRALQRSEALTAALRLMARNQPSPACLAGGSVPRSYQALCRTATACGLIPAEVDCLPSMTMGGPETLELCRQTQDFMGAN